MSPHDDTSTDPSTPVRLCAFSETSVLGKIVEAKIVDVRKRASETPFEQHRARARRTDRSFQRALLRGDMTKKRSSKSDPSDHFLNSSNADNSSNSFDQRTPSLIAEIKEKSPSKGALRTDLDALAIAAIYERHAHAISVVCDTPFFGGSLDRLAAVRAHVTLPVLLKDFIISEYQIYEGRCFGADAVLLMASVLEPESLEHLIQVAESLGMDALVEVHTEAELEAVGAGRAKIVGVNNRNLHTLEIDPNTFVRLAPKIPQERTLVAESGIRTRDDLVPLRGMADAVLIGSTLMSAPNIETKLIELGW
ncbi:MAG: indole-3-glycerol-phosphate synthase [Deltaproteobacteria bacterium]|nr:indole-3-glycerol-phosphate synthase [Deltaproteobacteria bacterium]